MSTNRRHDGLRTADLRVDADPHREVRVFYERMAAEAQVMLGASGFRVEVKKGIDTLAFSHENRTILVNPDFVEGRGLSVAEKRFVFLHEIGHFVQLSQDPDLYVSTFDRAEQYAKESGGGSSAKKSWDSFYNVFMDFHDNAIVEHRNPWIQSDIRAGNSPKEKLYEKLTEEDCRNVSLSSQFLLGLLRRIGIEGSNVIVDEKVNEVLDRPYVYLGKRYATFVDFVDQNLARGDVRFDIFLSRLERTAVPIFKKLLEVDIENGEAGDGTPSDLNVDGTGSGSNWKKIADEVKKMRRNSSEAAKDRADDRFFKEKVRAGFDANDVKRMLEIRDSANEVYFSMVDLWEVFVHLVQFFEVGEDSGYRSGRNVDVDSFVRQFLGFMSGGGDLRVFNRQVIEVAGESIEPKRVALFLALDLSGSMTVVRKKAVQEAVYALCMSLLQFRRNQQALDDGGKTVDVMLRLIGYGDRTVDLLSRSLEEIEGGNLSDDGIEDRLWRAILSIQSESLGGTYDSYALDSIKDEIVGFGGGDGASVVVELTDGDTETVYESKALVELLADMANVYPRALQFSDGLSGYDFPGEISEGIENLSSDRLSDDNVFYDVWGKFGKKLDGIENLKEVMMQILFKAIMDNVE